MTKRKPPSSAWISYRDPVLFKWETKRADEYVVRGNEFQLTVHRHIDSPGKWFVSAYPILDRSELLATNAQEAIGEACEKLIATIGRFRLDAEKFSALITDGLFK